MHTNTRAQTIHIYALYTQSASQVHMHACTLTYMQTHMHAHIHTCTQTHIATHMHTPPARTHTYMLCTLCVQLALLLCYVYRNSDVPFYANIMFDPRVIRGNTYAVQSRLAVVRLGYLGII